MLRRNPGFQNGIRTVWILLILSEHFAHASDEFALSQGITFTEIFKLYQTVLHSTASANYTKKKNFEEDIFYHFINFLEVLETKDSKIMNVLDVDKNCEITRKTLLSDIAKFCTGSCQLTKTINRTIQFDHLPV